MTNDILDILYESLDTSEISGNWFYDEELENLVRDLIEVYHDDSIYGFCMDYQKNGFKIGFRAAVKLLMEVGR